MRAHRLDLISAVFGLVAVVAAILVIGGSTVPFEANVAPWLAVAALAFGVMLLPWSLRASRNTETPQDPSDLFIAVDLADTDTPDHG